MGILIFLMFSKEFHKFLVNKCFATVKFGTRSFTTSIIEVNVFSTTTAFIYSFFES